MSRYDSAGGPAPTAKQIAGPGNGHPKGAVTGDGSMGLGGAPAQSELPPPALCMYFAGFAAGEGCFGAYMQGQAPHFDFTIRLRADDVAILYDLQKSLGGIGCIGIHAPGPNANPVVQWRVCNARELLTVVRVFDRYPIGNKKQQDFEMWRLGVLELQKPKEQRHYEYLRDLVRAVQEVRRYTGENLPVPVPEPSPYQQLAMWELSDEP